MAQRLGVAASTLRTWDRRYGIGPSRRSSGTHRRYSPADVARLEIMQRMILEGAPPGEAARVALAEATEPAEPAEPTGSAGPSARGHGAGGNRVPVATAGGGAAGEPGAARPRPSTPTAPTSGWTGSSPRRPTR
ncbi:MerR family transcriptional regulator, partial [Actinomadura fibrosa]|uniref:MerR family transcriptional regulator n=1 Tax=Actinomadura fibrosa TaxID=111802 RepID=UPI0027BB0F08